MTRQEQIELCELIQKDPKLRHQCVFAADLAELKLWRTYGKRQRDFFADEYWERKKREDDDYER